MDTHTHNLIDQRWQKIEIKIQGQPMDFLVEFWAKRLSQPDRFITDQ